MSVLAKQLIGEQEETSNSSEERREVQLAREILRASAVINMDTLSGEEQEALVLIGRLANELIAMHSS